MNLTESPSDVGTKRERREVIGYFGGLGHPPLSKGDHGSGSNVLRSHMEAPADLVSNLQDHKPMFYKAYIVHVAGEGFRDISQALTDSPYSYLVVTGDEFWKA